jgi:hypothetical protein
MDPNPTSPPLVTSYFNRLIVVNPESLAYRGSPVSPTSGYRSDALAHQVTIDWSHVGIEDEPSAMAAWFVNLVRPEIGPEAASDLQQLIQNHWCDGVGSLFVKVADYRHSQAQPSS